MGIPKRELQKRISSSQFVEAIAFLDETEWQTKKKWEYYAAAILLRLIQAFSSEEDHEKLKDAKIEDLLIVFKEISSGEDDSQEMSAEEIQQRQELSEILWRGAVDKKARKEKLEKQSRINKQIAEKQVSDMVKAKESQREKNKDQLDKVKKRYEDLASGKLTRRTRKRLT